MNTFSRISMASRRGLKTFAWSLSASLALLSGGTALAQTDEEPIPPEKVYWEEVIAEGKTWQLKKISGYAIDDNNEFYSREVFTLNGPQAIFELPLPESIQKDLYESLSEEELKEDGNVSFSIDKQIVDEIAISEKLGEPTPYLKEIAEKEAAEEQQALGGFAAKSSCGDQTITKSKGFSLNKPISLSQNFGAGFSGSLSSTGSIQGSATGQLVLTKKRAKVWFVCVPYAVKFNHARAYGNVTVDTNSAINGTVNYAMSWEKQVAKPHLGSLNFFVGPIPVHIGFNLPIDVGLSVNAIVTGTVAYNGSQAATGSFDYTCTLSNCTGGSSYNLGSPYNPQPVTSSISGRIYPTLWAQVAVRAYLYSEWVAHAQVGVRPYLYGDLWGYYGNTCGDANGDGINETVSALTFNLDWQLFITARASALGSTKNWNNLWSTNRRLVKFWDLIGSSALQPILTGPTNLATNTYGAYTTRMRPCWPYSNNITTQLNWGDGTSTSYISAPSTSVTRFKYWPTAGTRTVKATVLSDSHGRQINKSTSRSVTTY